MKNIRIGKKMYFFVSMTAVIIAAVLIILSYSVHGSRVDAFYTDMTKRCATTSASFIDGDAVGRLIRLWMTDEFRKLHDAANESGDEKELEAWLKNQPEYADYLDLWNYLETFRQDMGIKYQYIVAVDGKQSLAVLDPSEALAYQGTIGENEGEFGDDATNTAIPPTITSGQFGWLCSAYEPICDSSGTAIAVVGVDIDMTDVMTERHRYLITMLVYGAIMTMIALFLCIWLTRRVVIKPIEALTGEMKKFKATDEGYEEAHVAKLDIKSRDEIRELYEGIRTMQITTVDYMQNIARITAEKERIGAELNVATQIQADMLPSIFPAFPDRNEFDIYATMHPAKEVGGDFYDFFLIDDNHLGMVMADVSGKGVPAALFMVIAKTLIKNRALLGESPSQALYEVNNQLCEGNEAELFVTVWLGIIEISTGKGVAANAGHEHPVIRRAGGQFELSVYKHSPAVATIEGMKFREHEFELHPGDSLFVYTDGVTEATSSDEKLFGTDRMVEALNKDPDASPKELLGNLRSAIDSFVGDAPQFDDITMLGLTYYGKQ
ncbi:MAG: SpoIIE family protein phosphatase [Lachnospiraceae bacterium]|nr:SpoIIE family protein phosphatase [Lachnospiraceae bacterium]